MTRSIVAGVVALALVLTCGILEVVFLKADYNNLHQECLQAVELCKSEELSAEQFANLRNNWTKLREKSELLLPHQDVYELTLRFAEAQAYVDVVDYKNLLAQLEVIEDLLKYVPHLMTPSLNHIL